MMGDTNLFYFIFIYLFIYFTEFVAVPFCEGCCFRILPKQCFLGGSTIKFPTLLLGILLGFKMEQ